MSATGMIYEHQLPRESDPEATALASTWLATLRAAQVTMEARIEIARRRLADGAAAEAGDREDDDAATDVEDGRESTTSDHADSAR